MFIKPIFRCNFKTLAFFAWILTVLSLFYTTSYIFQSRLIELKYCRSDKIKFSQHSDDHVPSNGFSKSLLLKERFCLTFAIDGYVFNERGVYRKLESKASSCLVHSFSPQLEFEASRRFLDPARENVFYANSPAVLWHEDQLILVSRIWLDREKYEDNKDWPANQFSDNWLFTQRFDAMMRPISNGSIMGIPSPKQWWIGDGPIEPRLFKCKNRVLVSFNAAMAFGKDNSMDYTVLWDLERNLPIIPTISGGTPMVNATEEGDMPRDKHWSAFNLKEQLHFVHNLDPLRILNCTLSGQCSFVHREIGSHGFIFSDAHSHLRGGTPFELYQFPYYISIAHTTLYKKKNNHRYYSAHLVVLRVDPFRVVYVSDRIQIHKKLFKMAPMVRGRYIDDGFFFPVGLIIQNKDYIEIGSHINDFNSILLRLKGLRSLMERIISIDSTNNFKRGPPPGFLNQHIHDILVSNTKVDMVHQQV